jgi:hypothetical protein
MKHLLVISLYLLFIIPAFAQQKAVDEYFPSTGVWESRSPILSGFDTAKLNNAIRIAIRNESRRPRSMEQSQQLDFGKEPFGEPVGPFIDRDDPTGIIIHKGYIIGQWGDPSKVEMTHSVTKSFLSVVVGLAADKGLLNVEDNVSKYVGDVVWHMPASSSPASKIINPFASEHNKNLSWEVMLRQTSDWEGELWGKPDWADRPDRDSTKWHNRKRNEPGAVFEYNDVRVNALALAATLVWHKSLHDVLNSYIMKPIGASDSWHWHGYRNSFISINDTIHQSVSGGGHWGGGMFINAYDMARFGLLTLHKGRWKDQQLVSKKWIERSITPTSANIEYGYMNYFLNTNKKLLPAAPASAYMHVGNGRNIIYVDAEHDLVIVMRWIESNSAINEVVKMVIEAKQ